MDANSSEMRDLLEQLSRDIVTNVAPEELDIFDDLVEEYYDDPQPPQPEEPTRDAALGFGAAEFITAATPAAMAMTSAVFSFAVQTLIQVAQNEGADIIRDKVKVWFGNGKQPGMTLEDLRKARLVAKAEAIRFGMSEEQAEQMADAFMKRLVTEG